MNAKSNLATVDKATAVDTAQAVAPLEGFDPKKGTLIEQMLFDPGLHDRVNNLTAMLAKSPSLPKHARGNQGMMLWVLDMHLKTRLSALFLINGTFDPGGGKIGSTAELCLAVALATRAIKCPPVWEEIGDWDGQVQGKFEEAQGQGKRDDGSDKGKYAKKTYTPEDEKGLGLRVTIHWGDEAEPITYPIQSEESKAKGEEPPAYWMRDCYPRFSTLWATDPRQQTKNYVLRKIMRTVRPDIMNGLPVDEDAAEHFGPDRAKPINEPNTPNETLGAFAERHGKKKGPVVDHEDIQDAPDAEDGPPPGFDDEMVGETIDHRPRLWLNAKNPEYPVAANQLGSVMLRAIDNAKTGKALDELVNRNSNVILNNLKADDQDTISAAITAKRDSFKSK